jgi:hypothetical protein
MMKKTKFDRSDFILFTVVPLIKLIVYASLGIIWGMVANNLADIYGYKAGKIIFLTTTISIIFVFLGLYQLIGMMER